MIDRHRPCRSVLWSLLACWLAASAAQGSTYAFAKLGSGVALGDYAYRFAHRGRVKDFVLEAAAKTTAGGPAVRLLFGYQDEGNHYYAEASDTNCIFVRVEDGIERRIGTVSVAQLPRDAAVRLTLIRRRHAMALWLDGRRVADAYDGTFRSGRVGLAPRKESATIDTVKFQVVADVRFTDDFMRTSAEETAWATASGTWKLKSLPSASLSANAFMFEGAAAAGASALATRGHWFWHDYVFAVACQPRGTDAVGLAFYCRDASRYHLLRWESRDKGGRLQLLRVAGGQRTVLGTASLGFTTGQWYQLKVGVVGRRATAYVDGNAVLSVTDDALLTGGIGLYCEGADGALFDDVEVEEPQGFAEDFEHDVAGKWTALGGSWQRQPGTLAPTAPAGHVLQASAAEAARYISGEDGWADYTVSATVRADAGATVGLVAHYQDEAHYYQLAASAAGARITRVVGGESKPLAETKGPLKLDAAHRLALGVERGVLTARLDGRVLLRCCDRSLKHGRAGLLAQGTKAAQFDDVSVAMPIRPHQLFSTHDIFAAETSMADWAVRQSDWLAVADTIDGKPQTVHWHRADLPGDVEVEAKLGSLPDGGRCWVALAGDGQLVASGYRVGLARRGGEYDVTVARGTAAAAKQTLTLKQPPEAFSAERVGHAIVAHVDGQVALSYEDPNPLAGRRIAWAADGCTPAADGVNIHTRSVRVYAFHRAPVDWRPAAGQWRVTNRWHCDPRWSFFAGARQKDPLVALWNKREFGDEVTLEFAAGIRHDPDRGHTSYVYANDINAVLCGDGSDLTKGYNFVFGGWGNKHTRILRDGKVVATTDKHRMPGDASQHRYWFYVKVQKQGGRLRFLVDNQLVLEYNDPTPLTGNKVAIWTWNNDIMVARVRIATPHAAPCESPVPPPPASPACIYR